MEVKTRSSTNKKLGMHGAIDLQEQRFRREFYAAIVYGFGVSSLTGEYKVVRTFQEQHGLGVVQAEVYTLGTGRWRTLGPVGYWRNEILQFYGPFLNNHCHWIVNDNQICTFDLDKETFQFFPSPPSVEVNHGQSLGILKGCLCKLDTDYSELTIWVMKEYGIKNSWHKQVVEKRQTIQWPVCEPIHLITGLKDGSFLMVFENKLCVFDPRSRTIEDTYMFDPDLSGLAYRPSFVKLQSFESERVHMF
ncbi:hypothetical protein OSB04_016202 [Centaurea solstitialis]|uniref:F-box associated beta-propeller type 1 domain-containing protein n=1 Tax=Centaurea solstitialis TaxID=347529 RepID=A0AA38W886_9ASTR|nr:hypothetical protein OSB04_016202 [Centaurea solstitialis]